MLDHLFILRFISILLLLFSLGCTRTINAKIDKLGALPTPLIEPLPLIVGVYYGNDFRNYKVTQTILYREITFIYNVQFGKANIALFDYILSSLFETVIPVSHLPNGFDKIGNVDLIIEPRVDCYSPCFPIVLRYEMKLYFPYGEKIIWQIMGTSVANLITANNVIKHTQLAMRDCASQFMAGFCRNEKLTDFLDNQCDR